jgi:hypothetical protein
MRCFRYFISSILCGGFLISCNHQVKPVQPAYAPKASDIPVSFISLTAQGLDLSDGRSRSKRNLEVYENVGISSNQEYFSVIRADPSNGVKNYVLQLFNKRQELLTQKTIPALHSDEGMDRIIPMDDGKGLLQYARRQGSSFSLKLYILDRDMGLRESLSLKKENIFGHIVQLSPDGSHLFNLYAEETRPGQNRLHIEKWTTTGKRVWTRQLENAWIRQQVYSAEHGEYLAFGYSSSSGTWPDKLVILDASGKSLFDRKIDSMAYDNCLFYTDQGLILVQGRYGIHLIELTTGLLLHSLHPPREDLDIINSLYHNPYILATYSKASLVDGIKQYRRSYLCTSLPEGKNRCYSIPAEGKPSFLLHRNTLYLGLEKSPDQITYYEIKTPLYDKDY